MNHNIDLPHLLRSRLTFVGVLAALKAGSFLRKQLGEPLSMETKQGTHDVVTNIDRQAEQMIIQSIQAHFPEHQFLAEESGKSEGKDGSILWIIDPLDGTLNFTRQIPFFCVSIAATFQSDVLSSVVYCPTTEELFVAEKGSGAYLNGKKLCVTETKVLDRALVATGIFYNPLENPLQSLEYFTNFAKLGVPIRRMGSVAMDLAYLAAGRFDMFWEILLQPWDYAASKLLIEESGGIVSDFSGNPLKELSPISFLASNSLLHTQITNQIQTIAKKFTDR